MLPRWQLLYFASMGCILVSQRVLNSFFRIKLGEASLSRIAINNVNASSSVKIAEIMLLQEAVNISTFSRFLILACRGCSIAVQIISISCLPEVSMYFISAEKVQFLSNSVPLLAIMTNPSPMLVSVLILHDCLIGSRVLLTETEGSSGLCTPFIL